MTTFTAEDGEIILVTAVVVIEPLQGDVGREYYEIGLSGGQHITIKESFKARATFVSDWQAAV